MNGRLFQALRSAVRALPLVLVLAAPAHAEVDLFGRDAFAGVLDLRLGASDGERSWVDGGFGKTRFSGGGGDDFAVRAEAADAELLWTPAVGDVRAVVDVIAQPGPHHGVDLDQAYLIYKPVPSSETQLSFRAGLYYPPVSMEHEGYAGGAWTVADTITPSAINAWIGQEGKVVGGEATLRTKLGDHELRATGSVFGYGDTSGTLLALRGWTLDDVRGTALGRLPLPPLSEFLTYVQPPFTEPLRELDGEVGYYVRGEWLLPGGLQLNAIWYDNRGDEVSYDELLLWSWRTRYFDLGARWDLDGRTWLQGQVMTGDTLMGFPRGQSVWVDVDYASAYLLAARRFGRATVVGRVDWFHTGSAPPAAVDENYGEDGWSLTADYRFALTRNLVLLGEVLHVESDRPGRTLAGLAPRQDQTTLQASARFLF